LLSLALKHFHHIYVKQYPTHQKEQNLMSNFAEILAKRLRKMGVSHVFGMPGGASLPLLEAFRQEGIDFTCST
jgi:hypothetical protein